MKYDAKLTATTDADRRRDGWDDERGREERKEGGRRMHRSNESRLNERYEDGKGGERRDPKRRGLERREGESSLGGKEKKERGSLRTRLDFIRNLFGVYLFSRKGRQKIVRIQENQREKKTNRQFTLEPTVCS